MTTSSSISRPRSSRWSLSQETHGTAIDTPPRSGFPQRGARSQPSAPAHDLRLELVRVLAAVELERDPVPAGAAIDHRREHGREPEQDARLRAPTRRSASPAPSSRSPRLPAVASYTSPTARSVPAGDTRRRYLLLPGAAKTFQRGRRAARDRVGEPLAAVGILLALAQRGERRDEARIGEQLGGVDEQRRRRRARGSRPRAGVAGGRARRRAARAIGARCEARERLGRRHRVRRRRGVRAAPRARGVVDLEEQARLNVDQLRTPSSSSRVSSMTASTTCRLRAARRRRPPRSGPPRGARSPRGGRAARAPRRAPRGSSSWPSACTDDGEHVVRLALAAERRAPAGGSPRGTACRRPSPSCASTATPRQRASSDSVEAERTGGLERLAIAAALQLGDDRPVAVVVVLVVGVERERPARRARRLRARRARSRRS